MRINRMIGEGRSIALDDCVFVMEHRMIVTWHLGMLLSHTIWTPLRGVGEVLSEPLDQHPESALQAAYRSIAHAASGVFGIDGLQVVAALRTVLGLSMSRGSPGQLRWMAETWRAIDPIGYALEAGMLRRAPYAGVEAPSLTAARQSMVATMLVSRDRDDRLTGLRMLEELEATSA
jgi:hypothetical protein